MQSHHAEMGDNSVFCYVGSRESKRSQDNKLEYVNIIKFCKGNLTSKACGDTIDV